MSCDQVRTALSALLDGEDVDIPEHALRSHLAACTECAAFAERPAALRRMMLLAAALAVAERTDSIMATLMTPYLLTAAGLLGVWLLTRPPFASPVPS
jgi:predicted anti-sigma-YlaC factor YlaD